MRISTSQFQRTSLNSILDQQSKLNDTQQQLSTGKRILTPSDDPTASALLVDINQSIQVYQQYSQNASKAESRLQLEESTLSAVANTLQRVRELAVLANNDTYSQQDLQGIAVEARALQEELLGLANTKDADNDFLFSGFKGQIRPFEQLGGGLGVPATFNYNGDQGQRLVRIGPERQVADSDSGYEIFNKVPDPAVPGGYISAFEAVDRFAAALETGTVTGIDIENIDAALNRALQFQAGVGSRLNAITSQRSVNEDYIHQMTTTRSDLEDLDFADAVSRMNLQMTGLNAAQQTFTKVQGLSLFNYL